MMHFQVAALAKKLQLSVSSQGLS